MDRSFIQRNTEARERLYAVLGGAELPRKRADDGWTVGALLAHLAFWDRLVETRWDQYDRDGTMS